MNQIGIDISNDVFDVSLHRGDKLVRRQFTNRPSGHQQFMRWACQQAPISRVCMEATGIYHLQLALEMERHSQFQLMLINPWAARRFIQARMVRAKTDAIDADGLLQYLLQTFTFYHWKTDPVGFQLCTFKILLLLCYF